MAYIIVTVIDIVVVIAVDIDVLCYYTVDTEDEDDEGPPVAKKQKVDRKHETANKFENKLSFYVTKVRGIAKEFNDEKMSVGIKDILSSSMGDLQASAQVSTKGEF